MKSLSIAILLFFFCTSAPSQITVRVFNYWAASEVGQAMKPLASMEIGYLARIGKNHDGPLQVRVAVTYLPVQPRLEAFSPMGVALAGGFSGTSPYHQYDLFQFAGGVDYSFVAWKKFRAFLGGDFLGGFVQAGYISAAPVPSPKGQKAGGAFAGGRLRLGVGYQVSARVSLFADLQRSMFMVSEPLAVRRAYDIGLGMRFSF
ncbi:MAG: hypothetical protein H6559_01155 [Lewinellaceae bacterium]|nr:hypothetical protein [Lewinellaceae bacterium]